MSADLVEWLNNRKDPGLAVLSKPGTLGQGLLL
jgi:hypothetical protein